jgi:hypothetical protein
MPTLLRWLAFAACLQAPDMLARRARGLEQIARVSEIAKPLEEESVSEPLNVCLRPPRSASTKIRWMMKAAPRWEAMRARALLSSSDDRLTGAAALMVGPIDAGRLMPSSATRSSVATPICRTTSTLPVRS